MRSPLEALRIRPGEERQKREITKDAFGKIAQLAPQLNGAINFGSSSLASRIAEGATEPGLPLSHLVKLLDLKSTDHVHVYFPSREDEVSSPSSLWIIKGTSGKCVKIGFNEDTFALGKIIVDDELQAISDAAKNQDFRLEVFIAIKDDLLNRKGEWSDSMRSQREKFADGLRALGRKPAVAVYRVLSAFSGALPQEKFSVFGLIDGPRKDDEETKRISKHQIHKVRLFTTTPFIEDTAVEINNAVRDINAYPVEESTYSRRLDEEDISFDSVVGIPRVFGINPRKLTIRFRNGFADFPNTEVTVESLYPARIGPLSSLNAGDNDALYQPEIDPDEILERHFADFLAGGKPKLYPITAKNQEAVLLLKSPNSMPDGLLFGIEFLNEPGDFGA